ncbi:MAG TPA: hypothetical protein VGD66_10845 [Allosphingosinicella sp.]|jgi:hypothetical protein
MPQVSLLRLYAMRLAYFLIALFLGATIWPGIIHHEVPWTLMSGVAHCLLAALALLMALGIRYPLRMLPVLLFELAWKTIWLIAVGVPLWRAGRLDADAIETGKACLLGAILMLVVIPWPYVLAHYVRQSGERWK